MHHPPSDARAHARSGIEALRKGDVRQARESFERVVAAGRSSSSTTARYGGSWTAMTRMSRTRYRGKR